MEGTMAEIRMFAGNLTPKNWAFCNGQILSISSNQALFSLLGTTYGGDGINTFALPNFQSRVPVGAGHGPGLSLYTQGQLGGTENTTMQINQMPYHTHGITGTLKVGDGADTTSPADAYPGSPSAAIYAGSVDTNTLAANSVTGQTTPSGSGQPFSIVQPYIGMQYVICLYGIFPSRS